jgi:hypothetical protein
MEMGLGEGNGDTRLLGCFRGRVGRDAQREGLRTGAGPRPGLPIRAHVVTPPLDSVLSSRFRHVQGQTPRRRSRKPHII